MTHNHSHGRGYYSDVQRNARSFNTAAACLNWGAEPVKTRHLQQSASDTSTLPKPSGNSRSINQPISHDSRTPSNGGPFKELTCGESKHVQTMTGSEVCSGKTSRAEQVHDNIEDLSTRTSSRQSGDSALSCVKPSGTSIDSTADQIDKKTGNKAEYTTMLNDQVNKRSVRFQIPDDLKDHSPPENDGKLSRLDQTEGKLSKLNETEGKRSARSEKCGIAISTSSASNGSRVVRDSISSDRQTGTNKILDAGVGIGISGNSVKDCEMNMNQKCCQLDQCCDAISFKKSMKDLKTRDEDADNRPLECLATSGGKATDNGKATTANDDTYVNHSARTQTERENKNFAYVDDSRIEKSKSTSTHNNNSSYQHNANSSGNCTTNRSEQGCVDNCSETEKIGVHKYDYEKNRVPIDLSQALSHGRSDSIKQAVSGTMVGTPDQCSTGPSKFGKLKPWVYKKALIASIPQSLKTDSIPPATYGIRRVECQQRPDFFKVQSLAFAEDIDTRNGVKIANGGSEAQNSQQKVEHRRQKPDSELWMSHYKPFSTPSDS